MKSQVVLSLSIVMSLLASLAINSVGMAFALSESDITVRGNGDIWVTHDNGINQIDTDSVFIRIESDVAVDNFRCQLKFLNGDIVHEFENCNSSDTGDNNDGFVTYDNLNGQYTFTVEITSNNNNFNGNVNDNNLVLVYDFTTQGTTGENIEEPEKTVLTETPAATDEVTTAGGAGNPPWTACPSDGDLPNQVIPAFIKEIRYETLGTAKLSKVLESDKQDIDLEIGLNFVSGTTSGKITNDESTDFAVLNMHTECEYVAPESAFSPETGSISGKRQNLENSKISNPPFKVCPSSDESAKYEFNTEISKWMDKSEIDSIKSQLKTDQGVKMVITQFFKTNTGELNKPWYMGQLVIEGGKADGKKIDLTLDGTDIHTTCLQDTIAAQG